MLSRRIYKLIELVVNPSVKYFNVFNYNWNPVKNLFEKLPQKDRKSTLYYFNQSLVGLWIIFHFFQFIRFYTSKDLNSLVFLVACATLVICLCTIWDESYFPTINHAIVFLRQINGKFSQSSYLLFNFVH